VKVEANLSKSYVDILKTHYGRATTVLISQDEHPVYGVPYFFIHPCQTADRLSELVECNPGNSKSTPADLNYLLKWWSLVGPLLDLGITPKQYEELLLCVSP